MRLLILVGLAVAFFRTPSSPGDLAIGFDKKTSRPNVFIAWRNSQRILEVEVEVKNLGAAQASGTLILSLLDDEGVVLATTPRAGDSGQRVTLPPGNQGGMEGKIIQVKGDFALNQLIDRLDRANSPYLLRASLISDGEDS